MSDASLLEEIANRGITSPERKQLQRVDWLLKALDIFVAEGIDAVRITRLADDLGVTRGSFYWHFENREDLISALVSYWKDKNTPAITQSVAKVASLADGVLQFFGLNRLVDEVRSAFLDGLDSQFEIVLTGHHDHRLIGHLPADRLEQFDPGSVRKLLVEQYQVPGLVPHPLIGMHLKIGFLNYDLKGNQIPGIDQVAVCSFFIHKIAVSGR